MKILFLSTWYPYPPDNGSRIRAYHLVRALARRHDVTLVSFRQRDRGGTGEAQPARRESIEVHAVAEDPFRYVGVPTVVKFLSPVPVACWPSRLMQAKVEEVAAKGPWDALVAFQEPVARYALRLADVCRVLDVDVSSSYRRHQEYLAGHSRVARMRAWAGWLKARRYERRLFRQFDACTLVRQEEAEYVRSVVGARRVEIAPNGVDCERNRPATATARADTLVYNGSLTYGANYDAMRYFLSEIYPRIRARVPEVSLTITGSLKGVDLSTLRLDDSVTLSGYLEDIRPLVAGSSVCVVPLRDGGGTRIKILEAMALGTPVVSTTKGAEGLAVEDGRHLLLADDPDVFARRTVALLRNGEMSRPLASNARRLVEERYDWQRIGEQFVSLVEEVVATGERYRP